MVMLVPVSAAFIAGLVLGMVCRKKMIAWLASAAIVPGYVLLAEFVLPYAGGGASLWPVALMTGSIAGGIAGGVGVACGMRAGDWREWW